MLGGDGTYNEVLNGMQVDVPLGFLPGGGTSVLPRALGLPRNPVAAAKRVAEGRTRRIGVGRVNGRRFGFSAGLGFDAELVRRVDELGRSPDGRRPGDITFMRVAASFLRERHARFDEQVEIEGAGRAALLLVANCSPYTYSGSVALDLVPGASFDEGLAYWAPVTVRARDLPRIVVHGVRGSGLKEGKASPRSISTGSSSAATGRCPAGGRRGRRRRRRGRVRGGARCGDGARLSDCIVR